MRRPDPPPAVLWIARTLEKANHETWAVGGAVRDALLGIPSGDWDVTTHARPEQVRSLFRRTVPIGVEHGTVGVLARDGTMYEVTTFRRDVETDGRHAVVSFAEHVEDDLGRRDFTINAIAWHPLREELLDPYHGAGDLEDRVLKTVGDPDLRFTEDYLRVLRALRFAGRFHLRVEASTWSALSSHVEGLPQLSVERIRDELLKVLGLDPTPSLALELYADSGALAVLFPELQATVGSTWLESLAVTDALSVGRPYLRLAALLRGLPPSDAAALLLRLRLSNVQTEEASILAQAEPLPASDGSDADFRRWLSRHGPGRLPAIARIELAAARARRSVGGADRTSSVVDAWRRAREVRRARPPLEVGDLALDGRGLISLGLRPGPRFGEILDSLLDWVLEDPSRNERGVLEARVADLEEGEAHDGA